MDTAGRLGIQAAAGQGRPQPDLFTSTEPAWVEVDSRRVRTERLRSFGGFWLGLELLQRIGLSEYLQDHLPRGQADVAWAEMAQILVLFRFCHPSSELQIAEALYAQSALPDLLGVPAEKVNDDRLYRALDELLPHKEALEGHLKERLGTLFGLRYDVLLYDITSTYFEGLAERNPQAQRGYSRDKRGDCKQVCIGLVVSREGIPLGYEVFEGNRSDVKTVQEMVAKIEARYGQAERIWVLDRGMVSQENMVWLSSRQYIVGTARSVLKEFATELTDEGWEVIREGLEVKRCVRGEEVYIICRSTERAGKEMGIYRRFMERIEAGLLKIQHSCSIGRVKSVGVVERRIGHLLGKNQRAARFYTVQVTTGTDGKVQMTWTKNTEQLQWSESTAGYYVLRTNIKEWSASELWSAYIQLTQAEAAFRIQKSDLQLRPVWHQKEERVAAHILVCFLSYVLWKAMGYLCKKAGLGDEPRKVIDEISRISLTDVVLPTRQGTELRLQCITQPDEHQRILLQRLGLTLPSRLMRRLNL
jgi:transposase